ncbi:hypothetical protein SOPP22_04990 [Shewanella sp. OPT22]|nr:hypothetical protein SOPP22_04990 [Shewanella sp. OPT22]
MRSHHSRYIPQLDHLRFFAAMLIVVFHIFNGEFHQLFHRLHFDVGVTMFFTLSGFLFFNIAINSQYKIIYKKFILNRFLRIYPMIIFLFFLLVVLIKDFTFIDYLNLFSLNFPGTKVISWGAGDWGYQYLSFNWWTIGIEFVFYLVFPFLFQFYKANGIKYLWSVLFLIIFFRFGLFELKLSEYGFKMLSIKLNYSVVGNLDCFIVGMIAGHFYHFCLAKRLAAAREEHPVRVQFCFVCYVVAMWTFLIVYLDGFSQVLSPLVSSLLCAGCIVLYISSFSGESRYSRVLSYLGTLSFSIYLLHSFIGELVSLMHLDVLMQQYTHIPLEYAKVGQFTLITLPLIIIISSITYSTIEKPFLQLRVNYFNC